MVAGWLGWPPEIFDHTPVPRLELALQGAIEKERTIWGGGEPEKPKKMTDDEVADAARRGLDMLMSKPKANEFEVE